MADIRDGLVELMRAYQYTRDLQCDPWQLAVPICKLSRAGLTSSDLGWLSMSGYVDHAREVTRSSDSVRRFVPGRNLAFGRRTSFVLTDAGFAFVSWYFPPTTVAPLLLVESTAAVADILPPRSTPRYDRQRRSLFLGSRRIKRFRASASCQEAVLMAFQEDGWPDRIYDPLPPDPDYPPKQRLRETIRALNAKQEQNLIRFRGDGTGEGVFWELSGDGIDALPTGTRPSLPAA